jgi:membrane dipeptidase
MEKIFAALAILALGVLALAPASADDIAARAAEIHARAILVDTHVDIPYRHFRDPEFDAGRRYDVEKGHADFPRMREGGLDAPFFSIYIPATRTGPAAVKEALELIDWSRRQVERNADVATLATTAADIRRAKREGKTAVLLGMEGGHMIDDSLAMLRVYADLGVRYLTLTHGRNTNWADSSSDDPQHNGLTDFGREVVRELNRQGVMVDISHVADSTFWHALETSRAPLIASHSSMRALSNHPRNMSDEMVRAMAEKGGVIQITFVDTFLSQELYDAQQAVTEERARRRAELDRQFPEDAAVRREAYRELERELRARMPEVSWEKILDHIDHAVKIAGVDHVGIGSDFDGATMPVGMEDATRLPRLTEGLLRRGYTADDIEKILGGNLLRVMEAVERVSGEMRAGR